MIRIHRSWRTSNLQLNLLNPIGNILECFSHRYTSFPKLLQRQCFLEIRHCFVQSFELTHSSFKKITQVIVALYSVGDLFLLENTWNLMRLFFRLVLIIHESN